MNPRLAALAAAWLPLSLCAADSGAPVLRPFALMGNPAPVQMIVPGFVARELPVKLTNINNLAYGPEGRLYAYGFDGRIHRLTDTDGDGLEDKAELFYDNARGVIGTVGMRFHRGDLYLASRQQIMRFRDAEKRPADGKAPFDIVASGWAPPDALTATSRYMDVYGLAIDDAGNVFFGLGISDIRNAYRLDPETRESKYTRTWDRGTIQRVTPAGKREIVATGVRYTVSLAFNAAGDLFATDQEGATWLANGNPFDELLHIQWGRHYGFPPRHPRHLPDVVDEPSLFDYAPQHQATCSVNFDEPFRAGAPIFGPAWWRGDALVTGSSRGRIYRTTLARTAAGYVARNETIAHLPMLTIDAIVTPQGDLAVSCHSGRPDWGTGPTGLGKLYKISYRDRGAPQPVFAYAASPTETRIVFDRAPDVGPARLSAASAVITMGEYVSGGDRFEAMRPGYQAVKDQQKVARFQLPVLDGSVDAARRAIVLRTAPRTSAVHYSIALREGTEPRRAADEKRGELWQHAAVDVAMDLTGVAARWRDAGGAERWSGWLPHADLSAARGFAAASAEHAALFARLRERGTLECEGQLDLSSMLHPAVQPGAKLDFTYPPETVRVRFKSTHALDLRATAPAVVRRVGEGECELTIENVAARWVPFSLRLATGAGEPQLDVSWSTAEDARARPLALHRLLLPWATVHAMDPAVGARREISELAGGDGQRGRELFFGKATCAVCHSVDGKGGSLGPDLGNLVHRDYQSVLQDIADPNATLNPDYLAVTIQKKNGETVAGVMLQSWDNKYVLGQPNGEKLILPRDEVEPGTTKPLGVSLMPPGLLEALTAQERKDLLTFLLLTEK